MHSVGIAAFVIDGMGLRSCDVQTAPSMRAASVVKPLLFWAGAVVGPYVHDRRAWESLAERAVAVSDNDATGELWSEVGGEQLLATIEQLTGVTWRIGNGVEHPALRVLTTASELARAYAAFAADHGVVAKRLRSWMRAVPSIQTFGVRQIACEMLSVSEQSVGIKCGWFGVERVHAVALIELPSRTLGAVAMTLRPPDPSGRAACNAAEGNPAQIAAVHDKFAGPSVRSAIRRALDAAVAL